MYYVNHVYFIFYCTILLKVLRSSKGWKTHLFLRPKEIGGGGGGAVRFRGTALSTIVLCCSALSFASSSCKLVAELFATIVTVAGFLEA
jgi:hypothetical protein